MSPETRILCMAAEILGTPVTWTKGNMAKDGEQKGASIDGGYAASFCSLGAIYYASIQLGMGLQGFRARAILEETLQREKPQTQGNVAEWNDAARRRHKEIIQMFLKAIMYSKRVS